MRAHGDVAQPRAEHNRTGRAARRARPGAVKRPPAALNVPHASRSCTHRPPARRPRYAVRRPFPRARHRSGVASSRRRAICLTQDDRSLGSRLAPQQAPPIGGDVGRRRSEPSTLPARRPAASGAMATPHDLAYVAQHPLLTPGDRRGIVALLGGPRTTPRAQLTTIQNITIQRALPHGPRRIYRVYGSGEVDDPAEVRGRGRGGARCGESRPRGAHPRSRHAAGGGRRQPSPTPLPPPPMPRQVAFEALSNLQLIPAWDVLFKGARYLEWARSEGGGGAVEVGRIHLVYGLPGDQGGATLGPGATSRGRQARHACTARMHGAHAGRACMACAWRRRPAFCARPRLAFPPCGTRAHLAAASTLGRGQSQPTVGCPRATGDPPPPPLPAPPPTPCRRVAPHP